MALNATDDADERAKMLAARAAIEQVLRANDLCADVVIAGRGRVEVFTVLDASWSRVWLQPVPDEPGAMVLRVRSKAADYGGDKERQRADLEWTTGMVSSLAHIKGTQALSWIEASEYIDDKTHAEHTPLKPEPKQ